MRIFIANAILFSTLVSGAQSQTTKDPKVEQETIKIWRSGSQPSRQGPAENFTGSVRVDPMFQTSAPARALGSLVAFDPGARTAWHAQPLGQILIVRRERVACSGGVIPSRKSGKGTWYGFHPVRSTGMEPHRIVLWRTSGSWISSTASPWNGWRRSAKRSTKSRFVIKEATRDVGGKPRPSQAAIGDFAPKLAELTDNVLYGDVWERPELSKRDRSLVTVAALIALNRPEQLRSHLVKARENGVTQQEFVETITHLAFYCGWPNAVNAISVAKEVFEKK